MLSRLFEKPFRLLSLIGFLYLVTTTVLKIFTGFPFSSSIYPFPDVVIYISNGIALVLCVLTYVFYVKHFIYYISLEILVFANLYNGEIYIALFLSSILLILLITENRRITPKNIVFYSVIELLKLLLVIPFGVSEFFYYVGLNLFALCSIGCVNLLFRHAYSKKENGSINLDDLKLSERQKDCIKEIVLNNTTIKALSITHNVSESAIKKDLAHIYKILNISGKADLKALFIDYKF